MAFFLTKNTNQKNLKNCSTCCYSLWEYTGSTMCFAAIKKPSYGNGIENFFTHSIAFPPTVYYANTAGYSGDFFIMSRSHSQEHGTIGLGSIVLAVPQDLNSDGTGLWFVNYNIPKVNCAIYFKFQQSTKNSKLKFYYSIDEENLNSSSKVWIETSHTNNGDFFSVEVTDNLPLSGFPHSMEITIKAHFLLPDFSLGLQMPGRSNTPQFAYGSVLDSKGCFEGSYGNTYSGLNTLYLPPPYPCSRPYPAVGINLFKYLFSLFGYYILFPSVVSTLQNTNFKNEYNEEIFDVFLNIDFREEVHQFYDGNIFYFNCSAASYDMCYMNYVGFKARPLGTGQITITL